MHAETNIKKTKRAIKGLCGSFGMSIDDERVQMRLLAINTTKLRTSKFTPAELLYALYLGHPGLPINRSHLARASEERQTLLEKLETARNASYRYHRKDLSGETCQGTDPSEEAFKQQAKPDTEGDPCHHDDHMNGGKLEVGHDVWFRIFPGTKHGARWKRGVILGRGEDIISAGGTRIGDQSDRGRTVIPSHHYTIWDSQLQFITSRDRHHIRRAYSDKQRGRLLNWLDEVILAHKSQSKIRDHFNLDDQNLYKTKYPYSGNEISENEIGERDINRERFEALRDQIEKTIQEDLKTKLQSRLRFQPNNEPNSSSSNEQGTTAQPTAQPATDPPQPAEEEWPEAVEGPQDETNLDPDPLPDSWRREVDGHIQEADRRANNQQPDGPSSFIQRDVLMEPRRLRSAGMHRPLMIPDVFKRGGPRVQDQTFGQQTVQREAVSALKGVISEQEANKIISRIDPRKPINIYTMGVTASEARAGLLMNQTQRSPAQCIGPSQPRTKQRPAAQPAPAAEIKTLTHTLTEPQQRRRNAAKRVKRRKRYGSKNRILGRSTE